MIVKFLIAALVLSYGCRMITGQWPWDYLSNRTTRQQAVLGARKLLGVSSNATPSEINEAHRRKLALVHPDRGGSNAQVHEVTAARDLLLAELHIEN